MADKIPVYVINGFLESGKSSFFAYTIGQPYFQSKDTTLLILCEEGEVEFSDKLLKQTKTEVEVIEKVEDFTPAALMAMNAKHHPGRVLIEWNGMWDFREFKLPHAWVLEQQISCIDASTFGMYYSNLGMRSLLFEELKNSELVMFNRCDNMDEDELIKYKRNIKAIAQQADLIFEDKEGEIDLTTEEDLPFDINQDVIDLEGMSYGIWYLDAMEHPDRYEGKTIRYKGIVAVPDGFPKGYFVPGRMAMTCCADDMQFLGYGCKWDGASDLKERDWVEITGELHYENFEPYEGEGMVIHATKVEKTAQPEQPVINFAG